jgi:DNA polymerase I-like protein with 3'-5' exonuclease and polymerase domains
VPKTLDEIDLGDVSPQELIDHARERGLFVFDLETTGLDQHKDRIEGIAFYIPEDARRNIPSLRAWYPFTKGTMRCHVREEETPEAQFARLAYERALNDGAPATETNALKKEWKQHAQKTSVQELRAPMDQDETMNALRPLFEDSPGVVAVAHNAKFDVSFLRHASGCERGFWMNPDVVTRLAALADDELRKKIEAAQGLAHWGFPKSARVADSMLADFLCDENHFAYGLKKRTKDLFGHDMTTYQDVMKSRNQQVFSWLADELKADALGHYAMEDCYWTWRIFESRMEELDRLSPGQMLHEVTGDVPATSISPYDPNRTMGNLERIFWGIDMKIALVLEEMESRGVLIDWRHLKGVTSKLQKKKEEILSKIEQQIGWTLNPNSTPQVSALLFAKPPHGLGLPTKGIKQGKSGQYSTGSKEIAHLSRVNPIVKDILDWRSADTIIGNFSEKLTKLSLEDENNRIYSHFNQTGTKIYRLSSSNPVNLQNQPRDSDLIRAAFCAHLADALDPELLLFGCDYSQIELRVAAYLSGDKGMIEVYSTGKPCTKGVIAGAPCERYRWWECGSKLPSGKKCGHTWTPEAWDPAHEAAPKLCPTCKGDHISHQARCRHVDLHQRTAQDANVPRNPLAKNLNFGNLYRIGAPRFCQYADLYDEAGEPRIEYAQQVIDAWYDAYPAIKPFQDRTEYMLKNETNWIAYTITGRPRRLGKERYKNEYRAVTQGIQFQVSGSAQDILKVAMLRIWEAKNRRLVNARPAEAKLWKKFNFIIQVHDEIMCEGPRQLKDEIVELMTYEMENAADLTRTWPDGTTYNVPLKTDVQYGRVWDDIH